MRDVAVIGVGMQKWGELWTKSLRDIFTESALLAIDDAGVDAIEAMYVGCMTSGLFVGQEHLGSLLADYLGVAPIPALRVETACASGGAAFRSAFFDVASGAHDIVLAGGVEKMTDIGGGGATYALSTAADAEYEVYQGVTFPGLYAMMAVAHMNAYGTTRDQLSHVSVKNHKNGAKNAHAQYPFEVTLEQVKNSVMVADPLTILDCSPITDGAAAAILCPLDMASKLSDKPPIKILSSAHATDSIALHSRKDPAWLGGVAKAGEMAYKYAGLTPSDIDFVEVHDCFSIAEICVIEALGFFEKGKGGTGAESGETHIGGRIPVNPSGGLKSKGHPVGATGIAQVVEATKQLRGNCGDRQCPESKIGMTQNMGGTGGSCVVHILGSV
ncbi:MAG: thiolase domain-containing protein [Candidatus Eisenbacteria bacterium]